MGRFIVDMREDIAREAFGRVQTELAYERKEWRKQEEEESKRGTRS